MAILQQIDNLLGGVSQLPAHMRDTSEAEEQVNGLSHPARGLRKRPPSEHKAKLTSATAGFSTAFDYSMMFSKNERYRMIVVNGDLQIFDAITGAPITTYFPLGKGYLADAINAGFRAITVGDQAILLNRGVVTGKDTTQKSAALVPQALLWVQRADYQSTYTVTLNGQAFSTTTPSSAGDNARSFLNTDYIANQLVLQLGTSLGAFFTFTRFGSVIHVVRNDGADFTVSTVDGFGGVGFTAVKGSVQDQTMLPPIAKRGMIVAVTGLPESTLAPYYMMYDDLGMPDNSGVWRETVKPGVLLALDAATMPWRITRNGNMIDNAVSNGAPPVPAVRSGSLSHTDNGFNISGSETSSPETETHKGYIRGTPDGTDGTTRLVTVVFDLITSGVRDGSTLTVLLQTNTGPSTAFSTLATSGTYYGGTSYSAEKLSGNIVLPATAQVQIVLQYSGGVTPAGNHAYLLGHGKGAAGGSGIQTDTGTGSVVAFDATRYYPVGSTITITLDGTPFAYTVTGADQLGSVVAAGLQALINPSGSFDAAMVGTNAVLLTRTAGGAPVTTDAVTFDPAVTCHLPLAALVPGSQVGFTIKNLTDGSSGAITANTATTATVGALTGGSANKFNAGDSIAIIGAGTYFVLTKAVYHQRTVGDDTSAPFPSFVGRTLDELFFFQNRVGITSRDSVVMSRTGDRFNFFRNSAAQVLASDPIDVSSNVRKVSSFTSAVAWHDGIYLLSDQELFKLSGNPMAPTTVRLDAQGEYPSASGVRPIVAGGRLIMCSVKNGFTRVGACTRTTTYTGEDMVDAKDITRHIPTYIVGNPLMLASDPEAQMLAVLTDGTARRSLYVGNYQFNSEQFQVAWSRWDFPLGSNIIGMDILNGVVSLVVLRRDGVHLETITLDPDAPTPTLLLRYDGTSAYSGAYSYTGLQN